MDTVDTRVKHEYDEGGHCEHLVLDAYQIAAICSRSGA